MSRYSAPLKIHAEHWDPDEAAFLRSKLSFAAAQRVVYHAGFLQTTEYASEAAIADVAGHMAAAVLELVESWTLRTPGTAYSEGVDRPVWDLSLESIGEQPIQDVTFIFMQGMQAFSASTAVNPETLITETARAEGLTPDVFPPGDPTGVDLPGRKALAAAGS